MVNNQYLNALGTVLARTEIPQFDGASGYFSKPQEILDPALFTDTSSGPQLRHEIAMGIKTQLYKFWLGAGYHKPEEWASTWLAGSGASYQWAGDRGNGDLDIIIGIDWPTFYTCNPQRGGIGIDECTEYMDNELRTQLWPRTAHSTYGGKQFEVTYFVNADATDIRDILPYAAFNLDNGTWTVPPSRDTAYDHPQDPQWMPYARVDLEAAITVRHAVEKIHGDLPYLDGPHRVTALNRLSSAVNYAVGMMTDIHGNRRKAFQKPLGKGYFDFNNWRWQMAKKNGIVKVLGAIERIAQQAHEAAEEQTYGATLATADELTMRAAMAHRDAG